MTRYFIVWIAAGAFALAAAFPPLAQAQQGGDGSGSQAGPPQNAQQDGAGLQNPQIQLQDPQIRMQQPQTRLQSPRTRLQGDQGQANPDLGANQNELQAQSGSQIGLQPPGGSQIGLQPRRGSQIEDPDRTQPQRPGINDAAPLSGRQPDRFSNDRLSVRGDADVNLNVRRGNERWRFRRHNGEWWYWHPNDYWVYWRDGSWNRFLRNTYIVPRTYYYGYYPEPYYDGRYYSGYRGPYGRGYGPYVDGYYYYGDPRVRYYDEGGRIGAGIGGAIGGRQGAVIGGAIGEAID